MKQLDKVVPEASKRSILSNSNKWVNPLLVFASLASFTIMVLTKLWPCVKTSWPQDFCERWNDLWFGFSASVVAAIVFYLVFTIIPSKVKRNNIETLINIDITSILVHMNAMMAMATGHIISSFRTKDLFVEQVSTLDWNKEYPYLYDGMNQKTLMNCFLLEMNYARTNLESVLLRYNQYLNSEELAVITYNLIHHLVYPSVLFKEYKETIDEEEKKRIASLIYDFHSEMIDYACRFKVPEGFNQYSL